MRTFFTENDLISAEIQALHSDGSVAIHTRSQKYGKLQGGLFVSVPQALVKRCKQHFVDLPCGVSLILGNNGYIFLSRTLTEEEKADKAKNDQEEDRSKVEQKRVSVDVEARENIARVRNSIIALSKVGVPISPTTILDVFEESVRLGFQAPEILNPAIIPQVTQTAFAHAAASSA
eukprot:TRINITY_DN2318_c0_g1_i3.p1 TRINITY_DN2318_c0_g1~~TRINITY_DN2318_c0_g1_i3.p1  ORF type:complete len:202 (+),score=44.83 TRINITY_DN2318_c0_g1_i3:80-607(+)